MEFTSLNNLGCSGVKTFIIDLPLDPVNKALKHFSIESNEVLTLYRGVAKFDASGRIVVELPDYFQAIKKNQLSAYSDRFSAEPLCVKRNCK